MNAAATDTLERTHTSGADAQMPFVRDARESPRLARIGHNVQRGELIGTPATSIEWERTHEFEE